MKKQEQRTVHWIADADYTSGTLINHPAAGVGSLINDVTSGVMCALDVWCVVELDNSGVAFTAGATVGYDQTNHQAVVAAGGDFDIGKAEGSVGTGQKVRVWLNK